MLLMLFLVALFIGGLVFWTMRNIEKGKAMGAKFAPPPAAVTTVVVQSANVAARAQRGRFAAGREWRDGQHGSRGDRLGDCL